MTDQTEALVRERARQLFESEKPADETWGIETPDGRLRYALQERENPSDPTIAIIGDEKRARYMERARQQLRDEGLI